jgi:hypothetical protein
MPKQKISAKELAEDIRGGMDNSALAEKYKLSTHGLQSIFNKLIAAGVLQQAELDDRIGSYERKANFAWKCPACGVPQPREFEVCPACGVIVSKFSKRLENEQESRAAADEPKSKWRTPLFGKAGNKARVIALTILVIIAAVILFLVRENALGPVRHGIEDSNRMKREAEDRLINKHGWVPTKMYRRNEKGEWEEYVGLAPPKK